MRATCFSTPFDEPFSPRGDVGVPRSVAQWPLLWWSPDSQLRNGLAVPPPAGLIIYCEGLWVEVSPRDALMVSHEVRNQGTYASRVSSPLRRPACWLLLRRPLDRILRDRRSEGFSRGPKPRDLRIGCWVSRIRVVKGLGLQNGGIVLTRPSCHLAVADGFLGDVATSKSANIYGTERRARMGAD